MSDPARTISSPVTPPFARLAELQQQMYQWQADFHHLSEPTRRYATGIPELDRCLPPGGLIGNELIEWFSERSGSGAGELAIRVARQVIHGLDGDRFQRVLVVVDPDHLFYPPAVVQHGMDICSIVIVRPRNLRELVWAWDQALRSSVVAAVWGLVPRIDPRDFRRLQLAAEQGHTLGLLLRSAALRKDPSWAQLQLWVNPCGCPTVRLLRQKGAWAPERC